MALLQNRSAVGPPERDLVLKTPMQIRADPEHEIEFDIRMAFGKPAEQRLAIAAFGGREQRQAAARHLNRRDANGRRGEALAPATRVPASRGTGGWGLTPA